MWHGNKQILCICVILKIGFCCDCNKIDYSQNNNKNDNVTIGKVKIEDTLVKPDQEAYTQEEEHKASELNEKRFQIDDTEFETNESEENKDITCPSLRNGFVCNLDRIADVWQTIYYRTAEILSCFKIYIRKTTIDERKYYAQRYGNFKGSISWIECILEIQSSDKRYSLSRKHFLQGSVDKGVFENIIILKGNSSDTTLIVESPDQWMVFNNLLLMRDCITGDVIVFSRVPHETRLDAVLQSLKIFGEESLDGIVSCIGNGRTGRSIKTIPKEILRRYFRYE